MTWRKNIQVHNIALFHANIKLTLLIFNLLNCGSFLHCRKYGKIAAGFQEVRNALVTKIVV